MSSRYISHSDLQKLANKIFSIFQNSYSVLNCWGVYLDHPDFDKEIELRNKIGVIWFSSLFDTAEAGKRNLPNLHKEAQNLNEIALIRLCLQAEEFIDSVIDILTMYSREEQIAFYNLRNQWVHGYLAGEHITPKKVKYVSSSREFVLENIKLTDYRKIVELYLSGKNLDAVLSTALANAFNRNHKYWKIIYELKNANVMDIYNVIQSGSVYEWENLSS